MPAARPTTRLHEQLYFQAFAAMALGIGLGAVAPATAIQLKPLGDAFIALVKLVIAPIIFCTVVHGIAAMGDLRKLGRVGGKTLLYFEVVSTLALVIGLVVVNECRPGAGFNIDPAKLDPAAVQSYVTTAHAAGLGDLVLSLIPKTFFGALAAGDLLPVLLVAGLCALALQRMGERGRPILRAIELGAELFFGILRLVVRLAPIGVLGAMAFTVGSQGLRSLGYLLDLILAFYLTAAGFVVGVLGAVAWGWGFSIFRFLAFIKEELVLVLGTSSSETALPGLMEKMKRLGCAEATVGLVIPAGYSFNLDGTNIYMAMAAVFLAQATNTPLDLPHQLTLLAVAMVTSKGASGVTGAGFVCLAATLAAVPAVPIQSLALLVGIDRLMSQCRSFTNLIGNGVATVVISRWEHEISAATLNHQLRQPAPPETLPL